MRYTNYEMLKSIARAINSDEVDTLDETLESLDILEIMSRTLDDICSRRYWEFMKDKVAQLEAGTHAVELSIPDAVVHIQTLRYNTVNGWKTLTYLEPDHFMRRLQEKPASYDTVVINGVEIYPSNTDDPTYYTSFDEVNLVFDAYDSSVDASGLDYTKTYLQGIVKPTFNFAENSDAITQAIPELMFNYWLWEAISVASVELREITNNRAERSARRAYIRLLGMEPVTQQDGSAPVNLGRRAPRGAKTIRRV